MVIAVGTLERAPREDTRPALLLLSDWLESTEISEPMELLLESEIGCELFLTVGTNLVAVLLPTRLSGAGALFPFFKLSLALSYEKDAIASFNLEASSSLVSILNPSDSNLSVVRLALMFPEREREKERKETVDE
jgi:hypothetical protein